MNVRGRIFVVGIGPGRRDLLTPHTAQAIAAAGVVIGYSGYFPWIEDLLTDKQRIALPLGQEIERAQLAIDHARNGCDVAVISSGDAGIYGMASAVIEALAVLDADARPEIVVAPGVSALNAAAALLGAPLGHDFAVISLSDLLTPWEVIERRLTAAADADFVVALFNPRSQRRDWQLARVRAILLAHRPGSTAVGIVRNAFRPEQDVMLTTLQDMNPADVDMFSIVFIGNASSRFVGTQMLTPRGYAIAPTGEPR